MKEIRLNENTLKQIVAESVMRMLKEGLVTNDPNIDKWYEARQIMGAEQMLDALFQYLDGDTIRDFIDTLDREYEIWGYDDEEEDEEEDLDDEENEYPDKEDLNGYIDDYLPGSSI